MTTVDLSTEVKDALAQGDLLPQELLKQLLGGHFREEDARLTVMRLIDADEVIVDADRRLHLRA